MIRCTRCEGFIPTTVSACPNCSTVSPRGRAATGFLAVLGAGAAALTLMACYGAPPCDSSLPNGSDGGEPAPGSCNPQYAEPDAGTDGGSDGRP